MKLKNSFYLFIALLIRPSESFLGRRTYLGQEGDVFGIYCQDFDPLKSTVWHHEEITKEAIKEIMPEAFQRKPFNDVTSPIGQLSSRNFWTSLEELVDVISVTDEGQKGLNPSIHFLNEEFDEAQEMLVQNWSLMLNAFESNDIFRAKKLLGSSLGTIQDFYSYTNWVELGNEEILKDLGFPNYKITNIVESQQPTCKMCLGGAITSENDENRCKSNLLPTVVNVGSLTSSYLPHTTLQNSTQFTNERSKCIEEEINYNNSLGSNKGINKDLPSSCFSPHSQLHDKAGKLAVKATVHYLNKLRAAIRDESFYAIFGLEPKVHKFLILDTSEAMDLEIQSLKSFIQTESTESHWKENTSTFSVITYGESDIDAVQHFNSAKELYNFMSTIKLKSNSGSTNAVNRMHRAILDGIIESPSYSTFYVLSNNFPVEDRTYSEAIGNFAHLKQIKIIPIISLPSPISANDVNGEKLHNFQSSSNEYSRVFDSWSKLAAKTGNQMIITRPQISSQIFQQLIQSDPSEKTTIKFVSATKSKLNISFAVDSSMREFDVSVVGMTPSITLESPNGELYTIQRNQQDFSNPSLTTVFLSEFYTKAIFTKNVDSDGGFEGHWKIQLTPESSSVSVMISTSSLVKSVLNFYKKDFHNFSPSLRKVDGITTLGIPDYVSINIIGLNETSSLSTIDKITFVDCFNSEKILTQVSVPSQGRLMDNYIKLNYDDINVGYFAVIAHGRDNLGFQYQRQHSLCYEFMSDDFVKPLKSSDGNRETTTTADFRDEIRVEPRFRSAFSDSEELDSMTGNDQSSKIVLQSAENLLQDNTVPGLSVRHTSSCLGYLTRALCKQKLWTANVAIWDYGRGLQRVWTDPTSTVPYIPPGIPYLDFVYSNECCHPEVTIHAEDLAANQNQVFISVGQLDRLSTGAIVGISIGALVFLIILALLVALCIRFCCKKSTGRKDAVTLTRTRSRSR